MWWLKFILLSFGVCLILFTPISAGSDRKTDPAFSPSSPGNRIHSKSESWQGHHASGHHSKQKQLKHQHQHDKLSMTEEYEDDDEDETDRINSQPKSIMLGAAKKADASIKRQGSQSDKDDLLESKGQDRSSAGATSSSRASKVSQMKDSTSEEAGYNGTTPKLDSVKSKMREDERKLRLALIKETILKHLGLSAAPDIQNPSIPQIPTVQRAINEHLMQRDSPYNSGRDKDSDTDEDGDTLRPLQRIMVSYSISNSSYANISHTFQFTLKPLPYMYSLKKAVLWLYVRPVHSSQQEMFTMLEVNSLVTSKLLRSRKVKLEHGDQGNGKWYKFEMTKVVKKSLNSMENTIELQALAVDQNGINQLVLPPTFNEDRGYKPYLEILMVANRRKRSKRGLGLQCDATKVENRCCLYPMEVTFADFGWRWIIVPQRYKANYCSGECEMKLLQDYAHTSMVSNLKKNSSQIICCTPTALSSLSMLYFSDMAVIEQKDLPNMVVESCGCR